MEPAFFNRSTRSGRISRSLLATSLVITSVSTAVINYSVRQVILHGRPHSRQFWAAARLVDLGRFDVEIRSVQIKRFTSVHLYLMLPRKLSRTQIDEAAVLVIIYSFGKRRDQGFDVLPYLT